jgi:hypothetical protein
VREGTSRQAIPTQLGSIVPSLTAGFYISIIHSDLKKIPAEFLIGAPESCESGDSERRGCTGNDSAVKTFIKDLLGRRASRN